MDELAFFCFFYFLQIDVGNDTDFGILLIKSDAQYQPILVILFMILMALKVGKWDTFVIFILPIGQNIQSLFRIMMNELYI